MRVGAPQIHQIGGRQQMEDKPIVAVKAAEYADDVFAPKQLQSRHWAASFYW
jgi:hypothetical protein